MDLLKCILGLVPCGRLVPETPYELVVLLIVLGFSLLELTALAGLVLLPAAVAVWAIRAWRRTAPPTVSPLVQYGSVERAETMNDAGSHHRS